MEYGLNKTNEIFYVTLLSIDNLENLSNLVLDSFNKFVATDYSKEGQNTFYRFFDKGNMLIKTLENKDFIIVAKDKEKIVGVLSTRGLSHISLLFVDENYHGKGIARKLLSMLLENIKTDKVTVNSSPYAQVVYEKLGFSKTSEMTEKNGIKSISMELKY